MGTQEIVCRLCLKICESYKALEGDIKDFLNKLLPKINLAAVQKPVACTNCAEVIKKCCDFEAMYLSACGNIISFVNNKDAVKLDQIDVPLSRNENATGIQEDQDICGFCRSPQKNCSAMSLDVEEGDVLKKMIKECLSRLDLSINKKPIICTSCYGSLEIYFRFVKNCLTVEEKIKKYCETLDISSRSQIELSQLLQFSIRHVTTETDGNSVGIINVEEQLCEERKYAENREIGKECAIKSEQMSCDDSEALKVNVEHETKLYMDMTDLKFKDVEQFTPRNMLVCKEENDRLGVIKTEETFCGKNEIKGENLLNEEIEIKIDDSDFYRFEDGVVSPHPEVATRLLRSQECFISNLQGNFSESDIKHTLIKKDVSKIRMHQCDCCSYQAKSKFMLKRHLLVHKNPSAVTTYKCDSCSFQTKRKLCFKKHLPVHMDRSKVTMHKCGTCSFQTKYTGSLKNHMLVHRNPSEITMYKCDFCSFQTKQKRYLKPHSLRHKNLLEVTLYKCDSCSHQTKHKWDLKAHMLVHRNLSDVTMYKCDSCSFQTKYKYYLKRHSLVHKNPLEVTKYKCDSCSFQAKDNYYLKRHSLVHKNPLGVTVYKCDSCSFQTRHNYYLKRHSLVHKDPSEITMYKCDSCSFQTKREPHLRRHLLVHKDPSEVTMYKCDFCSFQAKCSEYVKKHILRSHKDPSETTTLKTHFNMTF